MVTQNPSAAQPIASPSVLATFVIDNQTFADLTLITQSTASSPTSAASAPRSIRLGQQGTVSIASTSGSLSYGYGNPLYPITLAWTSGSSGAVKLTVKPPATTADGLTLLALLDGASSQPTELASAAVMSPRAEQDLALQESTPERDRLMTVPRPHHQSPAAASVAAGLGVVHLYVSFTIRIDNQTGDEIALTSTNANLEVSVLKTSAANVTPPPTVENQAKKDFTAYSWPKAFAKYAMTNTNWNACWVDIRWQGGGPTATVLSLNGQAPYLRARTARLPGASAGGVPIFAVTIDRVPAGVPIAPIVGTNRDVYQTWQLEKGKDGNAHAIYTVGHAHTKDRMVLGIDISASQPAMDFKAVCDFVDSDGRRVWFCSAQCSQPGRGSQTIFEAQWKALSRTRLLRFPYVFLYGLDSAASKQADDATLKALTDAKFEEFKRQYVKAGGWRPYDLPPAIDFEPSYSYQYIDPIDQKPKTAPIGPGTASKATPEQRQKAWTLLWVMRTFIRRCTATFGTRPIFYSGNSVFPTWYAIAKLGMAQERPDLTWDDAWLDPVFGCRIWHSEYPYHSTPSTTPGAWPWKKPTGFTGPWFPSGSRWDIYQYGIARAPGVGPLVGKDAAPEGNEASDPNWRRLPEVDAGSLGALGVSLDMDVWNGSVPELVDLALQTSWDPHG